MTPYLNKFHQQLWITGQPVVSGIKGIFFRLFNILKLNINNKNQLIEEFSKSFTLNIHLHSDKDQNDEKSISNKNSKKSLQLHSEYFNRTRLLRCKNEVSLVFFLFIISQFFICYLDLASELEFYFHI